MVLTLAIPDELVARLNADGVDASRRALEAFGLEEYRIGRLNDVEIFDLLGFSTRDQLDGFLKQHGIFLDYSEADLDQDLCDLTSAGF